ncbi:MAG: lysylphosphatidylglycerol synthase domain-containing protein [Mesorhizobium sp.]
MKWKDYVWPAIGLVAVALSAWLLYKELRGISLDDVGDGLVAIQWHQWILAALGSIVAYAALAGYDHIALLHIGKQVPWLFISACSFTTYALSHNIGGSVISGAVIRYRAYGSKGLTAAEVGILVAICWFTFILATVLLAGVVLILEPSLIHRYIEGAPVGVSFAAGLLLVGLVALYVFCSWLHLRPLSIRGLSIHYPRLPIVMRQLIIGPLELLAAASIVYFALPEAGNPGFIAVLGVFIASFSVAQISHAPGGLGVLEYVFLLGLPEMDPAAVLAALLVFRLFYLVVPLALALIVVLIFERSQFARQWSRPLVTDTKTKPSKLP